jgi:hypothetical protein
LFTASHADIDGNSGPVIVQGRRQLSPTGHSPGSPPVITDKTLRLFAPEIKAVSKAMAAWEPAV